MKMFVFCMLLVSSVSFVFGAPYGGGYSQASSVIEEPVVQEVMDVVTQGYGASAMVEEQQDVPVVQPVMDVVTQGYGGYETTTFVRPTTTYGGYSQASSVVEEVQAPVIQPVMDVVTQGYGASAMVEEQQDVPVVQPVMDVVTQAYGGYGGSAMVEEQQDVPVVEEVQSSVVQPVMDVVTQAYGGYGGNSMVEEQRSQVVEKPILRPFVVPEQQQRQQQQQQQVNSEMVAPSVLQQFSLPSEEEPVQVADQINQRPVEQRPVVTEAFNPNVQQQIF